jgi:hypothetical protein
MGSVANEGNRMAKPKHQNGVVGRGEPELVADWAYQSPQPHQLPVVHDGFWWLGLVRFALGLGSTRRCKRWLFSWWPRLVGAGVCGAAAVLARHRGGALAPSSKDLGLGHCFGGRGTGYGANAAWRALPQSHVVDSLVCVGAGRLWYGLARIGGYALPPQPKV